MFEFAYFNNNRNTLQSTIHSTPTQILIVRIFILSRNVHFKRTGNNNLGFYAS